MPVVRSAAKVLGAVDDAAIAEGLLLRLSEQYFQTFQRSPSQSELQFWDRTIPLIAQDLTEAGLGEVEMLPEWQLPLTSRQVDLVLAGVGHDGRDRYILVEFKTWSEAELFNGDPELVLVAKMGKNPQLHPLQRVRTYRDYLLESETGIKPESVGCIAYLPNATRAEISGLYELPEEPRSRLFSSSDHHALIEYLQEEFAPVPGAAAADRLEVAAARPPKHLLDHARDELQGKEQYTLLDGQRAALDLVMGLVRKAAAKDSKEVVLVTGGPGSGKSTLGLALLSQLTAFGYSAYHATGSKAFTQTMRRKVAQGSIELKKRFVYFNSFMNAAPNGVDVLICDESHRIRETSANRFTRATDRTGRLQVEELIAAARVPVFLLDEQGAVRPGEIGTAVDIKAYAAMNGMPVHQIDLTAQFRFGGRLGYARWVRMLLGIESGDLTPLRPNAEFDLELAESPRDLEDRLRLKVEEGYSARITAGYCWPWSSPLRDEELVPDVKIGDWERPWAVRGERSVGSAPPASLWASREGGFGQIGTVYSAQGFEFDYNGVIIGPDLVCRDGRLVTDRMANIDPALSRKVSDPDADRLIRNTYNALLTRGVRGTVVYATDPSTREFLKTLVVPLSG